MRPFLKNSLERFLGCGAVSEGLGSRLPGTRPEFLFSPKIDNRAKKKPININIFGGTVSGTNRNRPWDTNGTPPRDKMGPVPGTNRPFSV